MFIILPQDKDFDSIYDVIKQTLTAEPLKLTCMRASEVYRSEPMLHSVLREIVTSEIVVVDITRHDTDIAAQLSLAMACKPDRTIIISQNRDALPKIFSGWRVFTYQNAFGKQQEFSNLLERAVTKALLDTRAPRFESPPPFDSLDGSGVRVAILDSGVDYNHPYLHVIESVSTSNEPVSEFGQHATNLAGVIASRHEIYRGIAPNVDLVNVKVLRSNGTCKHTDITRGIDAALDLNVDVLLLGIGFNQLPTWMEGGHGWTCADGRCPLCTAVDYVTREESAIVVAAAGTCHRGAEAVRRIGERIETEINCPGQARSAIAVSALSQDGSQFEPFTSRGLTAFGVVKPDIAAIGANVMTTVPYYRKHDEQEAASEEGFQRVTGTSIATARVAGVIARIIQNQRQQGLSPSYTTVREELLSKWVVLPSHHTNTIGIPKLRWDI